MAAQGHPAMAEMSTRQDWGVIPGGERSDDLRARVRAAIERIHARHPGERVVAVSHGGAIGAVLAEASGATTFAFAGADNASISQLVVLGERWTVRRFNDTGHLAGELSSEADAPT
jgi:probable phosphoglycerate mutase